MIQDIYPDVFHNEYRPRAKAAADSPVLCYQDQKVLARLISPQDADKEPVIQFPTVQEMGELADSGSYIYAFAVNETEYFLKIQSPEVMDGYTYLNIRQLGMCIPNSMGMVVFTGYHLHMWYRGRRYCGYCSAAVVHDTKERAVCCPVCGQKNYPRIMPAVIVGVIHGDRLLVTKYREGFRYYALIAGFTEIGETLEETVAREVQEETGLKVRNIRYYKSQPWGIAGDILAGFYCDVDGDTRISLDENELKVAEWKERDEIELQPNYYSLTNEMMLRFKEGKEC